MSLHEQAVIGAALQGPAGHSGILMLTLEDFRDTRHGTIATVMQDMIRRAARVDPLTLADELAARGKLSCPGGAGGISYLHDLNTIAPPAVTAEYHAHAVRQESRHRIASAAATKLVNLLAAEQAPTELDAILAVNHDNLEQIPQPLEDDEEDLPTVRRLLATADSPEDWLIPGLLERGERVVITGGEGGGKSTLMKQLAVCLAGGLNPWNGVRVADGMRVLYVDAELSTRQNRKNYRWIGNLARRRLMADGWEDRIFHYVRNDGLDLPGRDREWFHHVASLTSPDVIIAGPAYKCMAGDEKLDVDVMALLRVFDEVRVKHDAALIVEAHSPHGGSEETRPIRPIGSSVWLRWPEIGFGFKRDDSQYVPQQHATPDHLKVIAWRGQRDVRDWPDYIKWGMGSGDFPWIPTRPDWRPTVDLGYSITKELADA